LDQIHTPRGERLPPGCLTLCPVYMTGKRDDDRWSWWMV
jgi:hypothetical protein